MRALLAACLITLGGCAALGLQPATTPTQGIAYAYSTLSATLNTLAGLAQSGVIGRADATAANNALMGVKAALDTAQAAATSSAPVPQNVLTTATAALTQVAAFLACKQSGGASCQL